MKNKKVLVSLVVAVTILGICGYLINYHTERTVDFQPVKVFQVPNKNYDMTEMSSYYFITSEELLNHFLGKYLSWHFGYCYDSVFIDKIKCELNFKEYDYLLSPQKRIIKLYYSPSNTERYSGWPVGNKDVLEPVFDKGSIDSMYLHRIKKTDKFIQPGP